MNAAKMGDPVYLMIPNIFQSLFDSSEGLFGCQSIYSSFFHLTEQSKGHFGIYLCQYREIFQGS